MWEVIAGCDPGPISHAHTSRSQVDHTSSLLVERQNIAHWDSDLELHFGPKCNLISGPKLAEIQPKLKLHFEPKLKLNFDADWDLKIGSILDPNELNVDLDWELNIGPTPSKYIEEAGRTECHNLGVIDHSIAFYFICPLYSPHTIYSITSPTQMLVVFCKCVLYKNIVFQ